MFTGKSLEKLAESESLYKRNLRNRNIARFVNKTIISDRAYNFMGTSFGIDTTNIIPPFIPVGRGSDSVYGTLLSKCLNNEFVGS